MRTLASAAGGVASGLTLAFALGALAGAPADGVRLAETAHPSAGPPPRSAPSFASVIAPAWNAVQLPVQQRDAEAP